MKSVILIFCCLPFTALAQQHVVVSPNDEVIPLRHNEGIATAAQKHRATQSVAYTCGNRPNLGFIPDPRDFEIVGLRHKDVIAQWFLAKATGTIDTIFWAAVGSVGALDSTVSFRIFKSNVYSGRGPGFGPYRAPCTPWGYYINLNDADQGIAPFRDEATDTNWVSTAAGDSFSFDPIGKEIWGRSGYKVVDHANRINFIAMAEAGETLRVNKGDAFFITCRIHSKNSHPNPLDERTQFMVERFHVTKSDENYPSRLWRFYEHDSTGACNGGAVLPRGWTARGGFTSDSLDVAVWTLWYLMTVTVDVPPDVQAFTHLGSTFSTAPQQVQAIIVDCDPERPSRAGVKSSWINWQLNSTDQPPVPMIHVGGDTWQGAIPGEPPASAIDYYISAVDSIDSVGIGPTTTYRIAQINNGFYYLDTSASCTAKNIGATGILIPRTNFFLPLDAPPSIAAADNGTAGPFNIGGNFPFFGNELRYLWIGVNGAVGLTASPSETLHINSAGVFDPGWNFPQHRALCPDPLNPCPHQMPKNIIAPFLYDLWLGDSMFNCGRILYQNSYGGDSCLFVVQWDSLGAINPYWGRPECTALRFRLVLNRCDGTIEFQYHDVGDFYAGFENVLIGMQADSTMTVGGKLGYVFANRNGSPLETNPLYRPCIKLYPSTPTFTLGGWNLLSMGVKPAQGNSARTFLYPTSRTRAFTFDGSYVARPDTLLLGKGFWMKFFAGDIVGAPGSLVNTLTVNVKNGWNLIGAPGRYPVSTSSIVATGVSLKSKYYGYAEAGYDIATMLQPGQGYWIKADASGTLQMSGSPSVTPKSSVQIDPSHLNRIMIQDATGRMQRLFLAPSDQFRESLEEYELPPPAMDFDARFTSGRIIETFPLQAAARIVFPISIQAAHVPITISWNFAPSDGRCFSLKGSDGIVYAASLRGTGSVKFSEAELRSIEVELSSGGDFPTVFALYQNYPNPFNPRTDIRYQIAESRFVTLRIYDLLGQEMATLVHDVRQPGKYSVSWDASGFSSGIYFYQLTAGAFTSVRKLVVLK